ncbi:MarR family transcriptional regulator, 2-MHQ and catechol-resistance regulon repressor [Lentibacillus halodurans]|uniref:MarR family transcriptional regulator, 2-MHQ and catechol-resistance regulon repressor n=1 Tax=Lentibacillus halodurans TaxID=237679 RepID=A0A1I0Y1J8_9BACI|nr:MarR family transcriptional regulator [Lentibacillus halodurans]SFB07092.1 MarR family transcriptional regulator, 2-MHQ and catechol-resistance regulon repressor [Lentibacillus halodurans]
MEENLSLKSFVVLMKASKSVTERVKKDISRYHMKTSEFAVLEALYHKGDLTVKQISEAVLINTGSMTYVIDKLEARDLLERRPCKNDRRAVYIHITDEGRQLMDDIFPKHQKAIEEIFQNVTAEEKKAAIDILKRIGQK